MSASPRRSSCSGVVYFCFMMVGAAIVRVPPPGWKPAGYVAPAQPSKLITTQNVYRLRGAEDAAVLADLVGALPERHGRHRRARPGLGDEPGDVPRPGHRRSPRPASSACSACSTWAAGSSGRRCPTRSAARTPTSCFFALGTLLYALVPQTGAIGSVALFVLCFCVIISMYGGGFATVPAYLRDMFGTRYVGAIHGLLLTAWSMAGIFGPVLVNYIRQYKIEHGVPKAEAYNVTMYIMAGLLVVGFICNLFIQAVDERHHMRHEDADAMGMAD